ncbi:phage tail tube protein [Rhizobium leguminosarum]|uniref:phage tail tube protein n=1 Tax=Rhizobium leguminosarum TaxID=384 RepID=UPI003F9A9DA8
MADTKASIGYGITFEFADAATPTVFTYIAEIYDVTPPSDSTDTVDVTHMQSPNKTREFIDGLTDPGEMSFEMNLAPGSDSDKALIAAKGKRKWCRLTYPNGVQTLFFGVRTTYERAAPTDDKITATVTFKVSGEPVQTDPAAPRNISVPVISGVAKVGAPLTVDQGIWAGSLSCTYQWKVDGTNVSGETGLSYIPVTGDIGKGVSVQVTGANDGFNTAATSVETADVVA